MSSRAALAWLVGAPLVALATPAFVACTAASVGATDADLARAEELESQGAAAYVRQCARCHGEHGEGLAGSAALFGPGGLPEYPRDGSGPAGNSVLSEKEMQRGAGNKERD